MEPSQFFLRGEIDVATADGLLTTLRSVAGQQQGDVVVDCMDLTFIDGAGIGAFIVMHRELVEQGRCLCLAHASPFLTRLLAVLNLTHLLRSDPVSAASN